MCLLMMSGAPDISLFLLILLCGSSSPGLAGVPGTSSDFPSHPTDLDDSLDQSSKLDGEIVLPPYSVQMIRPSPGTDVVPVCDPNHVCNLETDRTLSPDSIPGCYCDDACEYFGDCCYDYEAGSRVNNSYHRPLENLYAKNISRSSFICTFLGLPSNFEGPLNLGYWLISFCPGQASESLRQLCDHPSGSDVFLQTPVTSAISNISYKNIYCALCHGEDDATLGLWKIDIKCSSQEYYELLLRRFQEVGVFNYNQSSKACNVLFTPPNNTYQTRICFTDVITNCTTESKVSLGEACASYTAVVYTSSDPRQIYKNPHCALQCGVNITVEDSESTCKMLNPRQGLNYDITWSSLPSFSMLVDYNIFKLVTSKNVVTTTYCPRFFVFDPTANRCRYLSYPAGGLMANGQCDVPPCGLNTAPTLEFRIVVSLQGEISCNASKIRQKILDSCLINPLLQTVGMLTTSHTNDTSVHEDGIPDNKTTCWQSGSAETSHEFSIPSEVTLETQSDSSFEKALDKVLKDPRRDILRCINLEAGVVLHSVAMVTCYSTTCDMRHVNPELCSTSWLYFSQDAPYMNDASGFLYVNGTWFSYRQTIFETRYFWRQSNATFERMGAHMQICDGWKLTCAFVTLNASLFRPITTEHANDSLEYIQTGSEISSDNYSILRNGSVQICSDFDRNGTWNTTIDRVHFPIVYQIISVIGGSLSMTSATATFLTYLIFPSLKNHIRCPLMNLTASLVLANLMLMLSGVAKLNDILCTAVAFCGHVFWLMTSAWSNVIAFTLNHVFSSRGVQCRGEKITKKQLLIYYLYAWGIPCFIAVPCLVIDVTYQQPKEGDHNGLFRYRAGEFCWVGEPYQLLYSLTLPTAVSVLLNVVLFARTVYGIRIAKMQSKMARGDASIMKQAMEELPIYLKISSLMGFSWLFAFLAKLTTSEVILYIFIILISLQGVLIFISFCCNSRVYGLWKSTLGARCCSRYRSAKDPASPSCASTITRGLNARGGGPHVYSKNVDTCL